jgi:hypothetical protein
LLNVDVGMTEANKRKPNDSVSTSTLSIVEQVTPVPPLPGAQTFTLTIGKFRTLLNDETTIGTVFAEPDDTGVAVGSANAVLTAAAGVDVPDALLVDVFDEPPPPPHPASATHMPLTARIHFNARIFSPLALLDIVAAHAGGKTRRQPRTSDVRAHMAARLDYDIRTLHRRGTECAALLRMLLIDGVEVARKVAAQQRAEIRHVGAMPGHGEDHTRLTDVLAHQRAVGERRFADGVGHGRCAQVHDSLSGACGRCCGVGGRRAKRRVSGKAVG